MKELEAKMREIEMPGLVWGASKLVPVGFGIKKLQVNLVVEDEKVSIDELQAMIEEDEDHVQSTDVVSLAPARPLMYCYSNLHLLTIFIFTGSDAEAVSFKCKPKEADMDSDMPMTSSSCVCPSA